jgi:hypothetical protein
MYIIIVFLYPLIPIIRHFYYNLWRIVRSNYILNVNANVPWIYIAHLKDSTVSNIQLFIFSNF